MDAISIAKIIENVNKQRGLLFKPIPSCSVKYEAEYSGEIDNFGIFKIGFTKHFPLQIPDIYHEDAKEDFLHTDSLGKLCLVNTSSILIDVDNPSQLVIDCIDRAIEIVNIHPDSNEYQDELQREFFSYWGDDDRTVITSILDTTDVDFKEYPIMQIKNTWVLAQSQQEAAVFLNNTLNISINGDYGILQALVIKLKEGSKIPTPFGKQKWISIRQYIEKNSNPSVKSRFQRYVDQRIRNKFLVLVLILPSKYGDIMFGFCISFKNPKLLPMKYSLVNSISLIDVLRRDYDYLLNRCGAAPSIKSKQVLLLGCGSIGGFVANNLCQMGVTIMDILDRDVLTSENVHRHILGFESLNKYTKNKADLMKQYLEDKYAFVDIDSLNYVDRDVLSFLSEPSKLSNYDLIISALGEPTVHLEINKLLLQHNIHTPFIICFNEPLGIGGHVILANMEANSCLRCLYTDAVSGELIPFRGSFVMPEQHFNRSLSGCSGSFVPYSVLDSQQTAISTSRIAIEVLEGKLMHNQVRSWKGAAGSLLSQGYKLSPVYEDLEGDFRIVDNFHNDMCPYCRGK